MLKNTLKKCRRKKKKEGEEEEEEEKEQEAGESRQRQRKKNVLSLLDDIILLGYCDKSIAHDLTRRFHSKFILASHTHRHKQTA